MTFTSVRPDCSTASAAPGTAGEQIAISSLQVLWALRMLFASSNACFCLSSQGRRATILRSGNFSLLYLSIAFCHSTMLPAVSEAVMIAYSPFPPRRRAAWSTSVFAMPSGVAWFTNTSRASGTESASHVTTMMPFARAFLSTEAMPSRFSTATAMTSTPRVIQPSTMLFWPAGSGSVGPSQMSFTPSSFAASSAPFLHAMKYALPLLLGIMATVRPPPDDVPAEPPPLLSQPARRAAARTRVQNPDFISHPLIAARRERRHQPVGRDGRDQQDAHQDARELRGAVGQQQPLLQDHDREESDQRARDGPAAAEDRRTSQHDRGDGAQFVARARVGLGLAVVGDVEHRGEARDDAGEQVHERHAAFDGDAGVPRALGRVPDGVEAATDPRAVQQEAVA